MPCAPEPTAQSARLGVDSRARGLAWAAAGLLALFLIAASFSWPATAQEALSGPLPPKAAELLTLLQDPEIRLWLEQQRAGENDKADQPAVTQEGSTVSALLDARAVIVRAHLASLASALPTLPGELRRVAHVLVQDLQNARGGRLLLHIAVVLGLGLGGEWLFRHFTARGRLRVGPLEAQTLRKRLGALARRAVLGIGGATAFSAAAGGAFLLFDWPPTIRGIVLQYLVAIIALRIALAVIDLLFAPTDRSSNAEGEPLRIIPMSDGSARFWTRWLSIFATWFALGLATVDLLDSLGMSPAHRRLVAYVLGLGLLAIALILTWRRPQAVEQGDAATANGRPPSPGRAAPWLLTAYFLLLWLTWVTFALNAFWFALITGVLLLLVRTVHRAVPHVLRPPSAAAPKLSQPSMGVVCLERGLRATLLIGAVLLLSRQWNIDLAALTTSDTLFVRLVRGVLGALVVSLLANFAWNMVKAAIDRKLAETGEPGQADTDDARRRARLRTLLPVLRTITLVVLVTMAAMMALASLGIEIGPLIAGAGVIGLAIGFGAQTLVRDVISGMFYLLDDAFRVGEYIESGNYKGTVESFSLRTVRLRHHRGPLYTVPFGVLGAIKNMSRDWVIDKLTVSVDYSTDLDKVKKLIKQVGRTLAERPELAPNIIEPLKLQGIEQFGDYGIQLRMKITTRPGEQFAIRRTAHSLIKKVFDANGIRFAYPIVQVSGEGASASAAAARQVLTALETAGSEAR